MVSLDFRNQVRMKLKTYEYESILPPSVYRQSSVGWKGSGGVEGLRISDTWPNRS